MIGFPWGPLIGSLAGVVVGLIVGISALRVRGPSLAVVTLAGVVAIEQFGFANRRWGAGVSGSPVEQPRLFGGSIGSDAGFRGLDDKLPSPVLGFLYLIVVIALCLFVAQIRRSVLGQQMLAVRANDGQRRPPASTSRGSRSSPTRSRRSSPALRVDVRLQLRFGGAARFGI